MKFTTAMLLAAGRGERLSPLTDHCPKPLLAFRSKPFIVHHLERLSALGIKKVIINVSYLAKTIIEVLGDGTKFGLKIEYSYENSPLGPGGGIRQALPLLGNQVFLLISSDIWTDFPLEKFFAHDWSLGKNLIHAIVTDKKNPHQLGDFDLRKGKLFLSPQPEFIYGSIAVIHPEAFAHEPHAKASLIPAFGKAIEAHLATGEYYQPILNVNTPEEYRDMINIS